MDHPSLTSHTPLPRRNRWQRSMSDVGASMLSYVAVLVVAALLAGTVIVTVASQNDRITAAIQLSICRILGNDDCPADIDEQIAENLDPEFMPDQCLVHSDTNHQSVGVDIAFFNLGDDYTFIEETFSDGTTSITLVDSATVGVSAGIGASANLGPIAQIGAEANIGADVSFPLGSTWHFDNPEDAQRFRSDLNDVVTSEQVHRYTNPLIGWVYDEIAGTPSLPDPDVTRQSVDIEVGADAGVFAGLGNDRSGRSGNQGSGNGGNNGSGVEEWGLSPRVGAEGQVSASGTAWSVEYDHQNNTTSHIYELEASAGVGVDYVAGDWGPDGNWGGMLKVTEDSETGEVVEITLVRTSGDEVTTTVLPVETPEDRAIVEEWVGIGHNRALGLTTDSMAPESLPDDANDFERLLFENGVSHRTTYEGDASETNVGASVKAGLQLGLNVGWGSAHQDATSAEYLGAPRGDQRPWLELGECVSDRTHD